MCSSLWKLVLICLLTHWRREVKHTQYKSCKSSPMQWVPLNWLSALLSQHSLTTWVQYPENKPLSGATKVQKACPGENFPKMPWKTMPETREGPSLSGCLKCCLQKQCLGAGLYLWGQGKVPGAQIRATCVWFSSSRLSACGTLLCASSKPPLLQDI